MPQALDKKQITITVDLAEYLELEARAKEARLPMQQYVRQQLGLPVRWMGRPDEDERERQADEAWDRLKRLGLEPEEFFPGEAS